MAGPILLFNIYEVAARLGVTVGTVWELMERKVINSHGYVYEQAIPVFKEPTIDKAREWLAKHGDKLPLRAEDGSDDNG